MNNVTNLSRNSYVIFINHERFYGVILLLSWCAAAFVLG